MKTMRSECPRWARRRPAAATLGMLQACALPILAGAPVAGAAGGDNTRAADGSQRLAAHAHAHAREDSARAALKFTRVLTADCMLHRSQLVRIANTDPNRAVRVVLWSYTGKTRSQASSEKTLPPHSGPVALGCDGIDGLQRRWAIEGARFIDPTSAH